MLVEVPGPKRRRLGDNIQDASAQWLDDFHASFVSAAALPALTSLATFVELPLPVKIGLDVDAFERMASQVDASTLEKICVSDTNAHCQKIWEHNLLRTLDPPMPGETESACIVYWDTFIRELIATVFGGKWYTNRNTSHSTSTSTSRPDMVFVLDDIGVCRGEEKVQSEHIDVPSDELRNKLVWAFGDQVPYIPGYAACGYQCGLYALYLQEGSVETLHLGMYTALVTESFKFVLALLQLCRLFESIVGLCPEAAKREIQDIPRSGGMVVRLNATCVVRDFSNIHSHDGVTLDPDQIQETYRILKKINVPRAEYLDQVSSCGRKFTFRPRGRDIRPTTLEELFVAIKCVLEALVVLHHNGWMHRDLRWPNVMRYKGSTLSWFIIDFVNAATSPQQYPSGAHLKRSEHAPELRVVGGSHTTAVDMWSVGFLIREWDTQSAWGISPPRLGFLHQLLDDNPDNRPTAEQALVKLAELREMHEAESHK